MGGPGPLNGPVGKGPPTSHRPVKWARGRLEGPFPSGRVCGPPTPSTPSSLGQGRGRPFHPFYWEGPASSYSLPLPTPPTPYHFTSLGQGVGGLPHSLPLFPF